MVLVCFDGGFSISFWCDLISQNIPCSVAQNNDRRTWWSMKFDANSDLITPSIRGNSVKNFKRLEAAVGFVSTQLPRADGAKDYPILNFATTSPCWAQVTATNHPAGTIYEIQIRRSHPLTNEIMRLEWTKSMKCNRLYFPQTG